ncbi:hypothetical protein AAMO2058_000593500 [Amorphochlora amoebiformis]
MLDSDNLLEEVNSEDLTLSSSPPPPASQKPSKKAEKRPPSSPSHGRGSPVVPPNPDIDFGISGIRDQEEKIGDLREEGDFEEVRQNVKEYLNASDSDDLNVKLAQKYTEILVENKTEECFRQKTEILNATAVSFDKAGKFYAAAYVREEMQKHLQMEKWIEDRFKLRDPKGYFRTVFKQMAKKCKIRGSSTLSFVSDTTQTDSQDDEFDIIKKNPQQFTNFIASLASGEFEQYYKEFAKNALQKWKSEPKENPMGTSEEVETIRNHKNYFFLPMGVCCNKNNTCYVTDFAEHRIREITKWLDYSEVAGVQHKEGYKDGPASSALFNHPAGIAFDDNTGCIYVADCWNHVIRRISPDLSMVDTYRPKDVLPYFWQRTGFAPEGSSSLLSEDIDQNPSPKRLLFPNDVAIGPDSSLYIVDTTTSVIRKMSPDRQISNIAGKPGRRGERDGKGSNARFYIPHNIAIDPTDHTLYVSDIRTHCIRRITKDGEVTTYAGRAYEGAFRDGPRLYARFISPTGVTVDRFRNLYIAEHGTNFIRKIRPDGYVLTMKNHRVQFGKRLKGKAAVINFNRPTGIAADPKGNIVVADSNGATVRRIWGGGIHPAAGFDDKISREYNIYSSDSDPWTVENRLNPRPLGLTEFDGPPSYTESPEGRLAPNLATSASID